MARDPNKVYQVDYANNIQSIDINSIPDFDFEDYDINNDKALMKLIFRIEKICRGSYEYKAYINFLKEAGEMNQCSFLKHITNVESRQIHIEIHHEPITLFDIVFAVLNRRRLQGESIHENMVAKEVMYNHYICHVGLIPLSETVHEIVHNQYLYIPTFAVFGKWRDFVKDYKDYISPEVLINLEKLEELSQNYDFDAATEILQAGLIHVNAMDPEYQATPEELYQYSKKLLDETGVQKKQ